MMETEEDIVVESPQELYRLMLPHHAKMRVENIGTAAFFFAGIKEYLDPNVCSCKKGEKRRQSLWTVYSTLQHSMKDEHKKYLSIMFGGPLVLMMEGVIVGRLE